MEALINMVPAQMQPVLDYLQLKQLKAVLEITLQSHAESSVPSRCDTTSNYWLGFNSYLTLNLWFGMDFCIAKALNPLAPCASIADKTRG